MPGTVMSKMYLPVLSFDSENLAKFQNVVREVYVLCKDYC